MWTVIHAYLLCILIIPYVEYPVPSVNIITDGNTELPEHVLRNHSQKFFWEGNQFAEVLVLNMNVMGRFAVCVRLGMLCSLKSLTSGYSPLLVCGFVDIISRIITPHRGVGTDPGHP